MKASYFIILPVVCVLAASTGCRKNEGIPTYRTVKDDAAQPAPAPSGPQTGTPMGEPTAEGLPPGHPPVSPQPAQPTAEGLPPGHPPISPQPAQGAQAAAHPAVGEVPEGWAPGPGSSMRQASYMVKGKNGATADISLVILGGPAGGVLDNVNRWRAQLGQPPLDAAALDQSGQRLPTPLGEAMVVDIQGLAKGANPALDGRMVAAVVERPQRTWFFKMRGNAGLVGAQKQAFLDWMATVKAPAGE